MVSVRDPFCRASSKSCTAPLAVLCADPAQPQTQDQKLKFTSEMKKYLEGSSKKQRWPGTPLRWGSEMGAPYSGSEWQMDFGESNTSSSLDL